MTEGVGAQVTGSRRDPDSDTDPVLSILTVNFLLSREHVLTGGVYVYFDLRLTSVHYERGLY